jgi:hypothetical protein
MMTAAASDVASIGSTLSAANAAAAAPTTGIVVSAEDEVSAAVASLFSSHAKDFQELGARAAAFHDQFVQALTAGAGSYGSAEAANVAALTANPAQTIQQDLLNAINATTIALTGRPLIANGANGAPGTAQNGAPGGWLYGNGGSGGSGAAGQNGGDGGAAGLIGTGGTGGVGGQGAGGGVGGVAGLLWGNGGPGGTGGLGVGTLTGGSGGAGGNGGLFFGTGGTGGAGGAAGTGAAGAGGPGGLGGTLFGNGGTGGAGGATGTGAGGRGGLGGILFGADGTNGAGTSNNTGAPLVLTGNNQVGVIGVANTALILGGTNSNPLVFGAVTGATAPGIPGYITQVEQLYLSSNYAGYTPEFLVTPEELYPLTGLRSLTFDASVARGVNDLNSAIMAQYAAGHSTVVFGTSQSAVVATLEERHLMTLPATQRPSTDQLSFVLVGNPDRPDGGFLERFDGSFIPGLGFTFFGATPVNAYPTTDIAIQYDGVADFPQYPLDIFADANAVAGFIFLHPQYPYLTPGQIASGVVEPVSPGDTQTTYILIPTQNLPLLDPVRAIPFVGNPLADLVQPDLKVLVELGYDRTAYQDVPTTCGLFPNVDPATVAAELQQGTVQGFDDAWADMGLPALPGFV